MTEAAQLHLPTVFLQEIPPDFIHLEFDDLRAYAAEYHPDEHRLVLHRSLLLNAAGVTLISLTKMTHKELGVLYHELFHAYMDYLASPDTRSAGVSGESKELLDFARRQQACRYGEVMITPVVQRVDDTESRFLTESESWEALNETWAVFVGWAIWNQLEIERNGKRALVRERKQIDQWMGRLRKALEIGQLRGYYVPADSDERGKYRKRFLAKQSQITTEEVAMLMSHVLGFPDESANHLEDPRGLLRAVQPATTCRDSIE